MSKDHPNEPQQPNSKRPVALQEQRRVYLASTYGLTPERVTVIRNVICLDATDDELEFFLATCQRLQLDPLARQIWFVKRRQKTEDAHGNEIWIDVGKPETSIDGFRTVAERSGQYKGQAPIEWCNSAGHWTEVWLSDTPPSAARASIYRDGFLHPMTAVAHWNEYCPVIKTKSGSFIPQMWRKMAANQLSKCAEALAFRRAFPRDLSGVYTDDEMAHTATEPQATFAAPATPTVVSSAPASAKPANAAPQIEGRKSDELSEFAKSIISATEAMEAAREIEELRGVGEFLSRLEKESADRPREEAEAVLALKAPFEAKWRKLQAAVGKTAGKAVPHA